MSHDLRRSLADLARAGSAETTPATEVVRTTSDIVDRRRRRRPVMIATVTAVSVLTAGAAAAAVYSATRDDASPFPDRPPVTQSADPTPTVTTETPEPTPDETVDPAPPVPAETEEPAPQAPTLAQLDPGASFPQCGAAPVATPGAPIILVYQGADSPAGAGSEARGFDISGYNQSNVQIVADPVAPTLALVQDGRVVGTSSPSGAATHVEPLTGAGAEFTSTLTVSGCQPGSDATIQLPAGFYEVWASQEWVVTGTVPEPQEYLQGPVTDVPQTFTTSDVVNHVWIGEEGVPVDGPQVAGGWPAQAEGNSPYGPPYGTPRWFVFLDQGSSRAELMDTVLAASSLGYETGPLPTENCPGNRAAELGLPASELVVGLTFMSREDVDAFTTLSGLPVLGVAEMPAGCQDAGH